MTANEMRNLLKELYDGASSSEMGYDDVEVSRFLNMATRLEIEKRTFSNKNPLREGFEVGSRRDTELTNLKKDVMIYIRHDGTFTEEYETTTTVGTVVTDRFDNGIVVTLPSDYMYILREFVDIKIGDNIRKVRVESINEDNIAEDLENTFKKPNHRRVLRTLLSELDESTRKRVKLFLPDTAEFYKYRLVYIKKPNTIIVDILQPDNQVNCELDDTMHYPIVQTAVQLMLGGIGSQKYQIAVNENKNNF